MDNEAGAFENRIPFRSWLLVNVPSYLLIENHAKERPEMILRRMNKNEERVPHKTSSRLERVKA
jgi:hypothetical protein